MKKILFISYDGMTDPLGQSQVIPYLKGLAALGYDITILSCEKPVRFLTQEESIKKILKEASIKWQPVTYHKKPAVLSTLYDVSALKRKAAHLHSKEKFDLVHTRPGIPALIGLWMKKKWGVHFLNDIREFYADSRVDGGLWNTDIFFYKVIYNFFKNKEREAVEKSDGIVCLTQAARDIISMWPHFKKNIPLKVIPCSVDMSLFDPENINITLRLKLKIDLNINDSDLVFSYLGSIGSWYLTDELMQFFSMIHNTIPSSKFLFISPDQHETIINAAQKFSLPSNKIIVKHVSRNEVPLILSLSSYSVFFIKPCYSKQSSSPTKHGEIMAMGIPVIANAGVGDVSAIIEKYNSGFVLPQLDEKNFKETANLISQQPVFDNKAIRNAALDYYNLDFAVKNYDAMYSDILKN